MTRDRAEALAAVALGWIAADPALLGALMATAGLDAADLRRRAADPEFLGFVLDFVLEDDARVLAVAAEAGLRPQSVAAARAALPGGDAPFWT
jgi:2-hydroxychromene-2-carboxylate isomerase